MQLGLCNKPLTSFLKINQTPNYTIQVFFLFFFGMLFNSNQVKNDCIMVYYETVL